MIASWPNRAGPKVREYLETVGFETWSSRDVLTADGQARPGQALSQSPAEPSARTVCESAAGTFRLASGGNGWSREKKSVADGNRTQEHGKLKSSHRHPGRRLSSGSTVDGDRYCGPVPMTANAIMRKQRSLGRRRGDGGLKMKIRRDLGARQQEPQK
ncbi:hypothetical protein BN1723_007811 [Verticillium longisporum]|nr:hypothetical protein BN1723_007811 [Verticillium longisporum]